MILFSHSELNVFLRPRSPRVFCADAVIRVGGSRHSLVDLSSSHHGGATRCRVPSSFK
jgi:hypothetical protein